MWWKVACVVLVIALVLFALFHFGLIHISFGFGNGKGDGTETDNMAELPINEENIEKREERKELTIVVGKASYSIDDKQVDISEIKRIVSGFEGTVIIKNNYASLAEWDSLVKELNSMDVTYQLII